MISYGSQIVTYEKQMRRVSVNLIIINKSMLAEIETLRAARAADVAEANIILGALTPLLDQGGQRARGGF